MENDLMSRSAVIDAIVAVKWKDGADGAMAMEIACTAPAISTDSLRERGRWEAGKQDWEAIRCSKCGGEWNLVDNCTETFDYCPSCGARMDLEG